MDILLFDWPFPAVIAGVAGLVYLLRAPRWTDPTWLACLMLPMYMVHQFEEHGFDAVGRRYHFITEMCAALGHAALGDCPADPEFIFAVNVGSVWIAGGLAILYRRTNPRVGAFALGIPAVNGLLHVNASLRSGAYTSGLVTSLVLFAPLCFLGLRGFVRAKVLGPRHIPLVMVSGVLLHAILAGSLVAHLPHPVLLLVQIANGFLVLAFARLPLRTAAMAT